VFSGKFVIDIDTGETPIGSVRMKGAEVIIKFYPDKTDCEECDDIKLLQVAKAVFYDFKSSQWVPFTRSMTALREIPRIMQLRGVGMSILQLVVGGAGDSSVSIYYGDNGERDTTTSINASNPFRPKLFQSGSVNDDRSRPAGLYDIPGWANDVNTTSEFRFETCAICTSTGKNLGCVKWGFDLTTNPNASVFSNNWTSVAAIPSSSDSSSPDFDDAVTEFNSFFGKKGP